MGPAWASMAYVARDRLVIQVTKDEILDFFYIGQLLEPVFLTLFGNSPIVFGKDTYRHCGNQWLLDGMSQSTRALRRFGIEPPRSTLGAGRICMPEKPVVSWQQFTEDFVKADKLMHRDGEGWLEMYEGRFLDFLEKDGTELQKHWKDHICFSWGPVSVDLDQSTITFQSADQQPFEYRSCFGALVWEYWKDERKFYILFMALCPNLLIVFLWTSSTRNCSTRIGEDQRSLASLFGMEKDSNRTRISKSKTPFTGVLEGIIEEATIGLVRRGLGEEELLKPIWNKLLW